MIPKIIHYCWFGEKPIPKNLKKYIDNWKIKLPEYKIIEWNENNFDITNSVPYVKEAYEVKKFAFVSDYVRIWALANYGGVYFDTDIEVLQSFDTYLENQDLVLGREYKNLLSTAFIACSKDNQFINGFLDTYTDRKFIQDDGNYDISTINEHLSRYSERYGLSFENEEFQCFGKGMVVYPQEVFSGFDVKNWHPKITEKTCTCHHMAASWVNLKGKIRCKIIYVVQKIIGYKNYDRIKALLKKKNRDPN